MKQVTALAIGGTAAGQMITGNGGLSRVAYQPQDPEPFDPTKIRDQILSTVGRYSHYKYFRLRWSLKKDEDIFYEFWIAEELGELTPTKLIEILMQGYRPVIRYSV